MRAIAHGADFRLRSRALAHLLSVQLALARQSRESGDPEHESERPNIWSTPQT